MLAERSVMLAKHSFSFSPLFILVCDSESVSLGVLSAETNYYYTNYYYYYYYYYYYT